MLWEYWEQHCAVKKKDVGMGLLVQLLCNLSCLHTAIPTPSFCGFWQAAIPTSLYILEKCFLYLFVHFFQCTLLKIANIIILAKKYVITAAFHRMEIRGQWVAWAPSLRVGAEPH